MIAGDPMDLRCIPGTARRPVVISTQLAPAYEEEYFLRARERMFATLRAYYGPSEAAIAELGERYGATHLWVRPDAVRQVVASGGGRWRHGDAPYGDVRLAAAPVRRAGGPEPAGRLPPLAQRVVRGVRHPLHRRPRAELICAGTSARGALPRADGVSAKPFAAR